MRDITAQLEMWLEQGLYTMDRVLWLTNTMESDDLVSMFAYAHNLEVKHIVREALSKQGLNPDGEPQEQGKNGSFEF